MLVSHTGSERKLSLQGGYLRLAMKDLGFVFDLSVKEARCAHDLKPDVICKLMCAPIAT